METKSVTKWAQAMPPGDGDCSELDAMVVNSSLYLVSIAERKANELYNRAIPCIIIEDAVLRKKSESWPVSAYIHTTK